MGHRSGQIDKLIHYEPKHKVNQTRCSNDSILNALLSVYFIEETPTITLNSIGVEGFK